MGSKQSSLKFPSSAWMHRECAAHAGGSTECNIATATSVDSLQKWRVGAPGWVSAGRWMGEMRRGGSEHKRKHVEPQHRTPWTETSSPQLRLEGAPAAYPPRPLLFTLRGLFLRFPCWAQGQWRNSSPKRKSRGTTNRTWSRVRHCPPHSITTASCWVTGLLLTKALCHVTTQVAPQCCQLWMRF